jgi:hypothetical protein
MVASNAEDEALFCQPAVAEDMFRSMTMIRMNPQKFETNDERTGMHPLLQKSAGATEHISRYDALKKVKSKFVADLLASPRKSVAGFPMRVWLGQ